MHIYFMNIIENFIFRIAINQFDKNHYNQITLD